MNINVFIYLAVVLWIVINLLYSECFKHVLMGYFIFLVSVYGLHFLLNMFNELVARKKWDEKFNSKFKLYYTLGLDKFLTALLLLTILTGALIVAEYLLMMYIGCYNVRELIF